MGIKNMKTYRLVALDLDETLLTPDSVLSEYAAGVLRAIAEKGVKVIICTGRAYAGSLFCLKQIGLNNPGIFCNGAQIRVALDGNILYELPLPVEEAKQAIRLGEEMGGHARIYMDDRIYVSHIIDADRIFAERTGIRFEAVGDLCAFLSRPPLKLLHYMSDPELVPVLLEKSAHVFQDRLYVTQSLSVNKTVFAEYMNALASKGSALKKVAAMWGISKDEILAAGDNLNDLSMFGEAGFSIAPQNAHPSILEVASAICLGNAEDGVPKKLAEIFLN